MNAGDSADRKAGPAVVVRHLRCGFGEKPKTSAMKLVIIDRFYTSVVLALQLLTIGFYIVGTIMTNRLGRL
ncbi:TPA: hypothetical protein N0F65_010615 [Lagenidium giganteum]|uniref:Uncharacterized protein n=1 Tax=Lagenidium giganteum TaxID=4803 RepID=A0AAV2ZEU1_9STRA|nr:TPA: hypothetical protein N0F65_010615 [Lagenidium giganteum]